MSSLASLPGVREGVESRIPTVRTSMNNRLSVADAETSDEIGEETVLAQVQAQLDALQVRLDKIALQQVQQREQILLGVRAAVQEQLAISLRPNKKWVPEPRVLPRPGRGQNAGTPSPSCSNAPARRTGSPLGRRGSASKASSDTPLSDIF